MRNNGAEAEDEHEAANLVSTLNVVNNVVVASSQSAAERAGVARELLEQPRALECAATHLDEILSDADADVSHCDRRLTAAGVRATPSR
jgi:hypothetical protein